MASDMVKFNWDFRALGSQDRFASQDNIMLGQASPVAHLFVEWNKKVLCKTIAIAHSDQNFFDWDLKLLQPTQHQGSQDWQISGLPVVAALSRNFDTVPLLSSLLYAIDFWKLCFLVCFYFVLKNWDSYARAQSKAAHFVGRVLLSNERPFKM